MFNFRNTVKSLSSSHHVIDLFIPACILLSIDLREFCLKTTEGDNYILLFLFIYFYFIFYLFLYIYLFIFITLKVQF